MFDWSLQTNILVFLVATIIIAFAGTRLSYLADRLADRTGWGEALVGALLLGGTTSLSGIVVSVSAAWQGEPRLAISNGIGGIAAQTVFLAIADIVYRRANLEHASASLANLHYGILVISLLAGVLLASSGPEWTILGIHPMTPVLLTAYILGVRLAQQSRNEPMWKPLQTDETRRDIPETKLNEVGITLQFMMFAGLAIVIGISGWIVAQTGIGIIRETGMSETVVGALFTAVSTSTPELITTIAAVRRGALTLAVGGILGGNAFDVLFVIGADVAYRPGSVYHAITTFEIFLISLSILMTAVLVLGLLNREERGIANIGFESAIILILYFVGIVVVTFF